MRPEIPAMMAPRCEADPFLFVSSICRISNQAKKQINDFFSMKRRPTLGSENRGTPSVKLDFVRLKREKTRYSRFWRFTNT
jgi:hypothetical protein